MSARRQQLEVRISEDSLSQVQGLFNVYQDKRLLVLRRSINHGARRAEKKAVDAMYARVNLTKKVIRQHRALRLATKSNLNCSLVFSGSNIGLDYFQARQTRRGVTFKIWRDGARERYDHHFMARGREGDEGRMSSKLFVFERNIFHRDYDGRLPLSRRFGPSIPTLFTNSPGVQDGTETIAAESMQTELVRQLNLIDRGLL